MEDEYKKWTVTALKKELSGLKVKIPPKTEHDGLIKLLLAEKEATDQTRYVLWCMGKREASPMWVMDKRASLWRENKMVMLVFIDHTPTN